ncbi:hypothetical protein IFM61606_09764 [Aspergillus udagawae]|uniref:Uncharacterized protein n=1 Tax=Aspergillus udagawae TaxID=91492 RepID=A0A8E0QJV7_9EURO|nr:uncharacterized protein Aud_001143 [Aspergillus udagawae]GFF26516.1 hypothetical protein IFM61606_09764 [Aspergillus udagawae]GFF58429.1 hypothetical protein IFM46972_11104 [Aspergillus udagawae]GFF61518.1 hypothetical protein IFM51744_10708 [Aspergillus udagawae]GFF97397.1 hypothetical protein IFM53868_09067 [Aspergillus udagawae]GFG07783.1 hypothetical protein IFM5058_03594 [Aspergillus udagawae]
MRQPEMSHSPAYYQDNDQLVTAYLQDVQTPATLPAAAHIPPKSSSSRQSHTQKSVANVAPSDLRSIHDFGLYATPDMTDTSNNHHRHNQGLRKFENNNQVPVGFVCPVSEQLVVVPVTDGAVRKDERIRGSWTDHSSYMSGDHYPHSAPRVHKRAIPEDDSPVDESQDALSMLFRLSLPVPVFSLCTSLYTVVGLIFVVLVSPLRLCSFVPYLRSTSFRAQLCDLLVPQLHIHERLVRLRRSTESIYNDPEHSSRAEAMDCYSVGGLFAVLLLSSLVSIAFLLLAWTAAFFWVFAMILGNPDGTERKDDGRAAVLGVCRWWHLWLGKARKAPR